MLRYFSSLLSVRPFYGGIFLPVGASPFTGIPSPAHPLSLRPRSSVHKQYRNVNLLSIAYAFRPQLRSRLPQGRSALPWNPQVFGLGDSHTHLATHSGILPSWNSTAPFGAASPLHQCSPTSRSKKDLLHGFGVVFQPRAFSARDLSASELLRTL